MNYDVSQCSPSAFITGLSFTGATNCATAVNSSTRTTHKMIQSTTIRTKHAVVVAAIMLELIVMAVTLSPSACSWSGGGVEAFMLHQSPSVGRRQGAGSIIHRQPTFQGVNNYILDESFVAPTAMSSPSIRRPPAGLALRSSSADDDKENNKSSPSSSLGSNKLDNALASLTSAFPFFVLGSAILALLKPSTLLWTNKGDLITIMLASVMWGTGLTLTKDDFTVVLKENLAAVPAGVLCQFLIMPLSACLLGRTILLPLQQPYGSALFLGLCLVGCSPGGTASNLVSLIAKADVALSVLLTSCSTILASVATPLLVKLLVGSTIAVSGWTLCTATARVVLLPVLLGMIVNARAPTLASTVSRFTPFCSVLLVALICGGVVAENAAMLLSTSAGLLPRIVSAVLGLHCLGFLAGYLVPKLGLGFGEKTSRTISIETGMQNSALAVVLARSIGAPAIASLPGALSATVHSCLGSILAAYWRGVDSGNSKKGQPVLGGGDALVPKDSPDDYPELLI